MKESLDQLYKEYGFSKNDISESIGLYLYEEGRYFGAEIIPLKQDQDTLNKCEDLRKNYAEAGYASVIKKLNDINEAGKELYKSFFSYNSIVARLKNRYRLFSESQTKSIGTQYQYINSPYLSNKIEISEDIIDHVIKLLSFERPRLIIIEAAAGYGKTCTSYEILNQLTLNEICGNPIMTELSRNRGASKFRYVLLDEIDREYPTLNSKLVQFEIRNGRIPLIIDGFDELLTKSELLTETEEVFGEVEPMLDTIGNLLTGSAKIILTTRKTAVFGGIEFDEWLQKWESKFDVTRISIEVPRIKDWLGESRYSVIKENNFPLEQIANPVLLTYLRNLPADVFVEHIEEPDRVVKKYFFSLMEREKIRQELYINAEDQYNIFKKLAASFLDFDITAEKKHFIKELIESESKNILDSALKSYPGNTTIENLLDKLVNHAILDRKGVEENMIGFINEFIFGNFIGEILIDSKTNKIENDYSAFMLEIGATAFRVQNSENKILLWGKINDLSHRFSQSALLNFDVSLRNRLTRNYKETEIKELEAYNTFFDSDFNIESVVFTECKFKNCVFDKKSFEGVTFISSLFDECSVKDDICLDFDSDNSSIKCIQKNGNIFQFLNTQETIDESDVNDEFQNQVLSKILSLQSSHKSQRFIELLKQFDKPFKRKVRSQIQILENQGLVKHRGSDIKIEVNRVKEVKSRLNIK